MKPPLHIFCLLIQPKGTDFIINMTIAIVGTIQFSIKHIKIMQKENFEGFKEEKKRILYKKKSLFLLTVLTVFKLFEHLVNFGQIQ